MIPVDLLVSAYASGWFPMAVEGGEIRWFSPDPRGVIPLEGFHVPSRLRRVVRAGAFTIAVDRAFEAVIRACADADRDRDDPGTWISEEIVESYLALHARGLAHSVEAWRDGRLAGGLYGVALRGAFFGESMFHRERDASKVALVALVEHLRARGFVLLDTQWTTPHLEQFGAIEITREEYLRRLARALVSGARFGGAQEFRSLRRPTERATGDQEVRRTKEGGTTGGKEAKRTKEGGTTGGKEARRTKEGATGE